MLFFAYFNCIYFKILGSFLASLSINHLMVRATCQLPRSNVNWASKAGFIFKIRELGVLIQVDYVYIQKLNEKC